MCPSQVLEKQGKVRGELPNYKLPSANLWIHRRWVFLAAKRSDLQTVCLEVKRRCQHLKAVHPDQVVSWKICCEVPG